MFFVDLGWGFLQKKKKNPSMQKYDGETLTEVMIARIRTVDFHTALEAMLQKQGHKVDLPVFFRSYFFPNTIYISL